MSDGKKDFLITTHDRVFNAWKSSTELVRDYQDYARETKNNEKLSALFSKYAEDEALHASRLLEILKEF